MKVIDDGIVVSRGYQEALRLALILFFKLSTDDDNELRLCKAVKLEDLFIYLYWTPFIFYAMYVTNRIVLSTFESLRGSSTNSVKQIRCV